MLETLATTWNVLLIIVGFSFVIFIHEMGHFIAAKWAGIRVHAFAIGFGRAALSYRKGLGLRAGSSENEYINKLRARAAERAETDGRDPSDILARSRDAILGGESHPDISPTEYRLNWFLFGGYVKMLGQEDANPSAVSAAPDSYTSKPVWKRMVVISAGVVMNIILAAFLFMIVFRAGLPDLAPAIGRIAPDSPAERAGITPGDVVTHINGRKTETFTDLFIASAMSKRGREVNLTLQRAGADAPINLSILPVQGDGGLRQIGVAPASSTTITKLERARPDEIEYINRLLERSGLDAAGPGAELIAVNNQPIFPVRTATGGTVSLITPLERAIADSRGRPIPATFRTADNTERTITINPEPRFGSTRVLFDDNQPYAQPQLLGLTPVMAVEATTPRAAEQGLRPGDVFARIGSIHWPSISDGIRTIRAAAGQTIPITVLRDGQYTHLSVRVSAKGLVGFTPAPGTDHPIITRVPTPASDAERTAPLPASRIIPAITPGSLIESIDGIPISDFASLRAALTAATSDARSSDSAATLAIALRLIGPERDANAPTEHINFTLTPEDIRALHELGWHADTALALFEPAQITLKAGSLGGAVVMGVQRTHRFIKMTYVTFMRLIDRSVGVEQISGPVGIVHIGSRIAEQGFIHVLFFMAMISANLAVINFLPIPITDGGMFILLSIEGITRRPVPIFIQNLATMAGLALIVTVFLVVTFNDIVRLFG